MYKCRNYTVQNICITEFLKVKIKFFQGAQILKMSARSEKNC